MRNYYIPFFPAERIDYNLLLSLYEIADYNTDNKIYDTIKYSSVNSLSSLLNVSSYAVQQILNSGKYNNFLTVEKKEKKIILRNDFKKSKQPFVVISDNEAELIKKQKDNLFSVYLLYVKYYIGHTKSKETDFTGRQFLSACGYCDKSNSYLDKLTKYNKILTENNIIKIEKYRDDLGHTRNRYKLI